MIKRIFKNSSYLFLSQSIVKVVSFLYTIFLARNLGVYNFGLYITALAYFSLISSFCELGISRYLVIEISKNANIINKLLLHTLAIRLSIIATLFLIFSSLMFLFDGNSSRVIISILAVSAVFPQILALTVDTIFIALQKVSISALGLIIFNALVSIFGIIFITIGLSSFGVVLALLIAQILYAIFLGSFLVLKLRIKINPIKIHFLYIKQILKGSLPYGLLGILGLLYFKIDALLLSYIKGAYDTGLYGAAYKFLEAIIFIPGAVGSSMFPVISKLIKKSPREAYQLYKKTMIILLLLSVPIVIAFLTILPIVIKLFLPKYIPSINIIKILAFTIPFFFMITPQAVLLFSQEKFLKSLFVISLINLIINIVLNLILIPSYSYYGSAWITVFSDILSFTIFFILIKHKIFKAYR